MVALLVNDWSPKGVEIGSPCNRFSVEQVELRTGWQKPLSLVLFRWWYRLAAFTQQSKARDG